MTTSTPTGLAEEMPNSARPRRRWPLWAGIGAAALGTIYLVLVAGTGSTLPRGTTVAGVEVGGLTEQQAVATLDTALAAQATAPLVVQVGKEKLSVVPADAGLSLDSEATVAGLTGRIWNPITLVSQFTGGPVLDPVAAVDEKTLTEAVATLAADSDAPATEPTLTIKAGKPVVTPGATGTVVDQEAARAAILGAYLRSTAPVVLPQVEAVPTVSDQAAQDAAAAASAAVAEPVTVTVSGITTTIPAATVARALSYSAKDGALVPALDGDLLRAAIAPRIASIETPGRDASWNVSSGKPVIVPSRTGKGVNPDLLAADVLLVLDKQGAERTVEAKIGSIAPTLTTEQAKALGVVERLSSFTQPFPYAAYRVQNIGRAAKSINNTLLLPGETFSLNKVLGERTEANGYTRGFVVGPGGVFREDLGGGVSASATTVWTAAFYAGLQRVHTQAHSIWIPRYRAGLEATVAWGQFDMSFRNDTKHAVLVTTVMKPTSLTVSMWGTKEYDQIKAVSGERYNVSSTPATQYDTSATCHAQGSQPGFSIDVYRVFLKDGKEVKPREKITTRYRPSPAVVCGPDPSKATPSPSASGSTSGTAKPTATPKPTSS